MLMETRQKKSKPDAVTWLKQVAGDAELVVAPSRKEAANRLDSDDDNDGVAWAQDWCPEDAEDRDGFRDRDHPG